MSAPFRVGRRCSGGDGSRCAWGGASRGWEDEEEDEPDNRRAEDEGEKEGSTVLAPVYDDEAAKDDEDARDWDGGRNGDEGCEDGGVLERGWEDRVK